MLELNTEYTYSQVCELLNWKKQSGYAKQIQIRSIEEAYKFYHPINSKTHKEKKSYIFTEKIQDILLVDGRRNNGATSVFPNDEFEYLLNAVLKKGIERNDYFHRGKECPVYISNTVIYEEFGFDCYGLLNKTLKSDEDKDEVVYKNLFQQIVFQAVKSNTITKICKKFGYAKNSLPKGILRNECKYSKSRKNVRTIPDDTLLDEYNGYEDEFIKNSDFSNLADVINNGLYGDMLQYIKGEFAEKKLYGVMKLNRIYLPDDIYDEICEFHIDTETKEKYQEHFKQIILDSIEKSIRNRINDVKEYSFKMNGKQKDILKDYFEQLSGRTLEIVNVSDDECLFQMDETDAELDALFDGKTLWGESDPIENDYSTEEILEMPTLSDRAV